MVDLTVVDDDAADLLEVNLLLQVFRKFKLMRHPNGINQHHFVILDQIRVLHIALIFLGCRLVGFGFSCIIHAKQCAAYLAASAASDAGNKGVAAKCMDTDLFDLRKGKYHVAEIQITVATLTEMCRYHKAMAGIGDNKKLEKASGDWCLERICICRERVTQVHSNGGKHPI